MQKFKMIYGKTKQEFEDAVNLAMDQGYVSDGFMALIGDEMAKAMILPPERQKPEIHVLFR